MKVLIAGATGAIGRALLQQLHDVGHTSIGVARSEEAAQALRQQSTDAVIADILERGAVEAALRHVRPDVVINELTALPKHYTPEEMQASAARDREVRITGNVNLLAAMEAAGTRRYLLQSSGFWYAPGPGLAHEEDPLITEAPPGVAGSAQTYRALEQRATSSPGIETILLRYGFFYGPGTWYTREGDIGQQVRREQVPVIGDGTGVSSFVHIEDAAAATAAALNAAPGAYNIADDTPAEQRVWLPAFARYAGAPEPPRVTEEQALQVAGPDAVYYAMRLRGASNSKVKRELGFRPRPLEWLSA